MNENEKEDIELDIEAKYVDKTEKEFLSRVTYAECLYILTPKNKYCDKIRELSVLKLCEIIEKLQKENEQLKEINEELSENKLLQDIEIKKNFIPKQTIKDKIEDLKMSGGSDGKDNIENTVRELVIEVLQDILDESEE